MPIKTLTTNFVANEDRAPLINSLLRVLSSEFAIITWFYYSPIRSLLRHNPKHQQTHLVWRHNIKRSVSLNGSGGVFHELFSGWRSRRRRDLRGSSLPFDHCHPSSSRGSYSRCVFLLLFVTILPYLHIGLARCRARGPQKTIALSTKNHHHQPTNQPNDQPIARSVIRTLLHFVRAALFARFRRISSFDAVRFLSSSSTSHLIRLL